MEQKNLFKNKVPGVTMQRQNLSFIVETPWKYRAWFLLTNWARYLFTGKLYYLFFLCIFFFGGCDRPLSRTEVIAACNECKASGYEVVIFRDGFNQIIDVQCEPKGEK